MMKKFNKEIDDQFEQAAAQNTTEKVLGHDRANDRSQDYYETLRLERLLHQRKIETLELKERELSIAERQQALKAEQDRDLVRHRMNMAHVMKDGFAFEQLHEKDAEEAKAVTEILSGVQLESIKTILVDALAEALKKNGQ